MLALLCDMILIGLPEDILSKKHFHGTGEHEQSIPNVIQSCHNLKFIISPKSRELVEGIESAVVLLELVALALG
jgi:hypothetical protein